MTNFSCYINIVLPHHFRLRQWRWVGHLPRLPKDCTEIYTKVHLFLSLAFSPKLSRLLNSFTSGYMKLRNIGSRPMAVSILERETQDSLKCVCSQTYLKQALCFLKFRKLFSFRYESNVQRLFHSAVFCFLWKPTRSCPGSI